MNNIPEEYKKARTIFELIKEKFLNTKNKIKVLSFYQSICELNDLYDIRIFENRFIIGGTVEYLFTALLNSFGFYTRNEGHMTFGTDIAVGVKYNSRKVQDYMESKFSLKYSSGKNNIIISNTIGGKPREWTEPTIFIIRDYKIFYADPLLVKDVLGTYGIVETKSGSNVVFPFKLIKNFVESVKNEYVIDYNYRCIKRFFQKRVVSYDVAKGILENKTLKKHLNMPYQVEVAQVFPEYLNEEESPVSIEISKSLKHKTLFIYPFSI